MKVNVGAIVPSEALESTKDKVWGVMRNNETPTRPESQNFQLGIGKR